jgi:hypothetical protein
MSTTFKKFQEEFLLNFKDELNRISENTKKVTGLLVSKVDELVNSYTAMDTKDAITQYSTEMRSMFSHPWLEQFELEIHLHLLRNSFRYLAYKPIFGELRLERRNKSIAESSLVHQDALLKQHVVLLKCTSSSDLLSKFQCQNTSQGGRKTCSEDASNMCLNCKAHCIIYTSDVYTVKNNAKHQFINFLSTTIIPFIQEVFKGFAYINK